MQQQYCLRWNNHKNNLLTVFSELFKNEDFTDVTLACEGGSVIKCHKMVLAASSSYFQNIFSNLSCSHPVVVLKDITYREIQAILEYMYKGEVSVTEKEVEPLLRVAEALKIKGLTNKNDHGPTYNSIGAPSSSLHDTDHSNVVRATVSLPNNSSNRDGNNLTNENQPHVSDDKIDRNITSPPHSTSSHKSLYSHRNVYFDCKSPNADRSDYRIPPLPIWPMSGLPMAAFPSPQTTTSAAAAAMLNSYQEAAIAVNNASMPPLKRKKLSGSLMSKERDTPILRTVLGQGQTDTLQPMSLVCHDDQDGEPRRSVNGSAMPQDLSYMNKVMKIEALSEGGHSPYQETSSFMDEGFNHERGSKSLHSSSPSPQSFYMDSKGNVSSALANCVQSQQQEYKRYKQYTKSDISSAIESVRLGMTALKAAKKFGVPSRTLYDKVKKLGITTTRTFRRTNGGNGTGFTFGISGAASSMLLGLSMQNEDENSSQGDMLEHGFLHHALESNKLKMEDLNREAAISTPRSFQAYEFMQQNSDREDCMNSFESNERRTMSLSQGNTSDMGMPSSPTSNNGSPSPNLINYDPRSRSLTPSPPLPPLVPPPPDDNYQDEVEDLSMSRKPEQQSGVIMPPMKEGIAAAMLANCGADNERD